MTITWEGPSVPTSADLSHGLDLMSQKYKLSGDEQSAGAPNEPDEDEAQDQEFSETMSQADFEKVRAKQERRGQTNLVPPPKAARVKR